MLSKIIFWKTTTKNKLFRHQIYEAATFKSRNLRIWIFVNKGTFLGRELAFVDNEFQTVDSSFWQAYSVDLLMW